MQIVSGTCLAPKGVAEHCRNTTAFEKSVLSSLLNVVFDNAEHSTGSGDTLLGRHAELPDCPGVVVADRADINSFEVTRGDAVSRAGEVGLVVGCTMEDNIVGVLVETTRLIQRRATHTSLVERTGVHAAWHSSGISLCLAWKGVSETELLVVLR